MNHTTNYNLSQWDAEDKVQRADFNADNAKLDAALKAQADALAAKSAALQTTLNGKGNCRIETFSLYDDGDPETSISIHFSAKPVAFLALGSKGLVAWGKGMDYAVNVYRSQYNANLSGMLFTWSGNTATTAMLNNSQGTSDTYTIVAFYAQS